MPAPIGLTEKEATSRLKEYGANELKQTEKEPTWKIFLSQFTSPLILILIVAAIVSYIIGAAEGSGAADTILILVIVFASGLAGFFQDYKAERAIEALQKMAKPHAVVIRGGREVEVLASEIVPGDILVLEGGDVIPADAKVIDGKVEVDESVLTGESRSVKKKVGESIFSGTSIYCGRVLAKVEKTGMETEIGRLAGKMQEITEEKTPFQIQMDMLGKKICYSIAGLLLIMVLFRYLRYGASDLTLAFMIAISIAVAAIPEGLPAVLTIGLSRGAGAMAKKNALVRKLNVVESVGTIDTICTDKTGTITEGRLKVREFFIDGREVLDPKDQPVINCGLLCNDAKCVIKDGREICTGDENDVALMEFFGKKSVGRFSRIDEISFNSERKMQTVVCEVGGKVEVYSKGAPEVLITKCSKVLSGGKYVKLTEKHWQEILGKNDALSSTGRRVLGLAYKPKDSKDYETGLIWLGLVSFSDPPRSEVKGAIEDCKKSGIRTIMITGDNPKTALAVAREVGLDSKGAVTGDELDKMSDEKLTSILADTSVFARTSPMHKLRILEFLQKQGHIVAMTGDGVNDSLAVKKADIGVAMGIKGTEVTKEVADIILLDDNFATIRTAISEGRRIFDNIRKFVNYMFTCNIAEVIVVFLGTLFFKEPLLLPAQILWINLVTDGLPSIALSTDPARSDVMERKPKKKGEGIIDRELALSILEGGLLMSATLLALFYVVYQSSGWGVATTAVFAAFVFYEFIRIISIKRDDHTKGFAWLSNRFLVVSMVISVALQLALLAFPVTRGFFRLEPLGLYEYGLIVVGMLLMHGVSLVLHWSRSRHH